MAAESCSGSLKPAAKLVEVKNTILAATARNTMNILFILFPSSLISIIAAYHSVIPAAILSGNLVYIVCGTISPIEALGDDIKKRDV
jgi:hypothetical protein